MAKRLSIIEEQFLRTIEENNLIEQNNVIICGVSGGPDSITLLNLLIKYKDKFKIKIIVCHLNHMIREEANLDENYVKNFCMKSNVEFFSKKVNIKEIAKQKKKSTEEIGRIERYKFFNSKINKTNIKKYKIAIAHNMNDNAETILLNLIRGTGLSGLEGIQPKEGIIIRPLINCERKDIEKYCITENLKPRIDKTNFENIYTRNKVRNIIIPDILKINPNFVKSLSRTSKIIKDENTYIQRQTYLMFEKLINEKFIIESKQEIKINIKELNILDIGQRRNIILLSLNKINGNLNDIEKVNVDDAIKLSEHNIGRKYIYINKNLMISTIQGNLIISRLT